LNAPGREQHDPWQAQAREFGDMLANGERIPDFDAAIDEQRHAPRRRLCGDLRLIIARVEITICSRNSKPALRKNSQGRNDQLE